jgi:type II secretory pathway predicted ATPase ExeA
MYYSHFGLSGAPFQFTPSPKLLFMSKAHRETLATLEWALADEPSGFSLLVGETGTGKTTLIISLLAQSPAHVRPAYVSNPKLGFDGLLRDIARQLGVPDHIDRLELFRAFDRYLEALAPNERVVVIVDEAQALSNEILEDLRLFANRELDRKALHFLFVGQPGLPERLSSPELRQVNERIGIRALLNPLEPAEARAYVDYRLAAFGGSAEALFATGALDHLLAHSGGIPRRINVFCHNALLRAYRAVETRVSLEASRHAAIDVEDLFAGARGASSMDVTPGLLGHFRRLITMTRGLAPALVAATLSIAGIGSLYFWNSGSDRRDEPFSLGAAGIVGDAVIEYPGTGNRSLGGDAAIASTDRAQDQQQPRRVRVEAGDTLVTIARAYLGSEVEVDRLIKANPQIGNVNHIYPGEVLNLPASGAVQPEAPAAR